LNSVKEKGMIKSSFLCELYCEVEVVARKDQSDIRNAEAEGVCTAYLLNPRQTLRAIAWREVIPDKE
jgi:hypothetical protein